MRVSIWIAALGAFVASLIGVGIALNNNDPESQSGALKPPACPLEAVTDDSVIVNLGSVRVRSDTHMNNARSARFRTDIPAGTYEITVATWDGQPSRASHPAQPHEEVHLQLTDSENNNIFTGITTDLTDNVREALQITPVDSGLTLANPIREVRVFHPRYPDKSSPNSVIPLCALFQPVGADTEGPEGGSPDCSDGIDNDDDGFVDYPNDPGCYGPDDTNEVNVGDDSPEEPIVDIPECRDGLDNDTDGTADADDPGCYTDLDTYNPNDDNESNDLAVGGVTLTADPIVVRSGEETTISWSVGDFAGRDACQLSSNLGGTTVNTNGSTTDRPSVEREYTLTCRYNAFNVMRSVRVQVIPSVQES